MDIGTRHAFFHPASSHHLKTVTKLSSLNDGEVEATAIEFSVTLFPSSIGFEKFLYILYGLAADGQCDADSIPRNVIIACILGNMSDTWIGGRWIEKLAGGLIVKFLARVGRWWGLEKKLVEKYWGVEEEEGGKTV